MNTFLRIGLVVLVIGSLVGFVGCEKTEPESPVTPTPAPAVAPEPAADAITETLTPVDANKLVAFLTEVPAPAVAPEPAPVAAVETLTGTSLDAIPLADIKAEIAKLGVDKLREKALEYKKAIDEKRMQLTETVLKMKDAALTAAVSEELKTLQGKYSTLSNTLTALTERHQLYYDKIKELGGSVADLEIEK